MQLRFDLDSIELAESYEKFSDSQFFHGKVLINMLKIKSSDFVLDIGCGTGRLTQYISELLRGGKIIGIDPLPYRIKIAKEKETKNLFFEVGGTLDLHRFQENSFDCILLNSVFHWIENKAEALEQIKRILKPGGRVGISTGDKNYKTTIRELVEQSVRKYVKNAFEFSFSPFLLSSEEIKSLINKSGLHIEQFRLFEYSTFSHSPEALITFLESSSFGNFLSQIPLEHKSQILADIKRDLEKLRTPKGIERKHLCILVVATKSER
ncbi:class I SAM-dependent methyltransferase [Candidatus Methylacidiphilum fumarolicum]|uniref:Methylase involved in ubiquinone/menaquinone biosynthesis n=2 Tax=Candidatus Methylacidiphilum fumarolicum TaxID=591154 RepID=I0JY45_METFB|nr:class I SAM-dependent methyltransferase [Candidatus Methylacidiphilum fumarolicum]MBW6415238.1 methyltransferase domain-containing protein [Candidatus Methylacidiphilum fumarolicum]TFE69799.1 ubiquinone biosynthesis protein [Candidatus Methylacidiphilum fumarolicum]TFE71666.1 class I SAM-dependent methyltransferase [Candidatus Methylacidiphilum fumarolicum]TFE72628.1 class I SAM-dependent methyltransferase [Candidatus Methylacidiphilum fumarolicum]TFE76721.1 ubiquinone biosynthesis protein 